MAEGDARVDFNEAAADAEGTSPPISPGLRVRRSSEDRRGRLFEAATRRSRSPLRGGAGGFKAAAAFYPPCANEAEATLCIPTLILVGAEYEVTPAADCAELAKRQAPGEAKLVVYPGAAHAFDLPEFVVGGQVMGMTLAYDRGAAERAWAELRNFLQARLGR